MSEKPSLDFATPEYSYYELEAQLDELTGRPASRGTIEQTVARGG